MSEQGWQHSKQTGQDDAAALKRRFRTNFTETQSVFLEESFQESHYPDQAAKREMARALDIPEDRITVWFQNRRAKWRRKEMREKEKARSETLSTPVYAFEPSYAPEPQYNGGIIYQNCPSDPFNTLSCHMYSPQNLQR